MTFFSTELGKYKFPHFPFLELDDGNRIFSSDAIIKYILPDEKPLELRDQVNRSSFRISYVTNSLQ